VWPAVFSGGGVIASICWRCGGFGWVVDRIEAGYTVYKVCEECRPQSEDDHMKGNT
jgi:hypothetical protein